MFRQGRQGRRSRRAVIATLAATIGAGAAAVTAVPGPAVAGEDATGQPATAAEYPYQNARLPIRQRVADLVSRMSLEEKVGQMTQAERANVDNGNEGLITSLGLGSVLSGGGSVPNPNTPAAWTDMVDRFQKAALATRWHIPLLYGVDSVHGHGNLYGATVFPHNIGLGATRDPALVREVEHITADETRATGPQWVFAPCICAARDDRWGRTYESFSENPDLVIQMESAIAGFQGFWPGQLADRDRVLATAKHFAGDGDTVYGSAAGDYKIDQGVSITNHQDFWNTSLRQYQPAVRRYHVGTVMPSYSSVDWTEDGVGNPIKMHASKELITDVLKGQMGFDGFVISDYNGIHQIPAPPNTDYTDQELYAYQVRTSVNAGLDMAMEPSDFAQFVSTLVGEVNANRVPMSRIDDAVSRILTKKFQLGLFERPYTDRTDQAQIGSPAHRAVARRAVAESQVLLKNRLWTLPLRPSAHVYVAGSNADDLGNQAGGWTLSWQGASGRHRIPGTTILEGIQQAADRGQVTYSKDASAPIDRNAVGVVVVGETPYAEGFGDVGGPQWAYDPEDHDTPRPPQTMQINDADKTAIDRVCAATRKCVVVIVSGRPLIVDPQQLDEADALVAAWLPGSEGEGVADTLFGVRPFTGRLPMTWPKRLDQEPINVGDADYDPLFPYGFGLRTRAWGS